MQQGGGNRGGILFSIENMERGYLELYYLA
jgi:hypothetical protein